MLEIMLNDVAPWISDSFPIIRSVIVVLIALAAIIMVIAILASPAQVGRGSNAITGASESYYTKNKGKTNQGRVRNIIIICAVTIALLSILYFITIQIYHPQLG